MKLVKREVSVCREVKQCSPYVSLLERLRQLRCKRIIISRHKDILDAAMFPHRSLQLFDNGIDRWVAQLLRCGAKFVPVAETLRCSEKQRRHVDMLTGAYLGNFIVQNCIYFK